MSLDHRGHKLLEGIFCCRSKDNGGCEPTILSKTVYNVDLLGEYRAEDGWAECRADQVSVDVFRVKKWSDPSGVLLIFFIITKCCIE